MKINKEIEFEILHSNKHRIYLLCGIVCVVVLMVTLIITTSKAKYRTTQSLPLINGTINYSAADLNIVAITVDGEIADRIPQGNYTLTEESYCTVNGEEDTSISLSYDVDTKTLNVSPLTTRGTKCYLYFEESKSAADIIEGLYEDNQDILAYDGTEDNNLRYIGADPANYVYFNCSDYSNPSSSTCELWRIIGIFDENTHGVSGQKLVKLIRNESIGNYSWDNKTSGVGSSTSSSGSNDWSDSRLMMLLNPGYEEPNGDIYAYEGSLYYN